MNLKDRKIMINANRVTEMVKNSLFNDDEIIDGIPTTEPIKVNGIMHNIGFHKERLESHRDEVKAMLAELPLVFQPGGGGGYSFLQMCMTKDDEQWTSLHRVMEELCVLAIGLKLGAFPMPRELWHVLPGGMPYFSVVDESVKMPELVR